MATPTLRGSSSAYVNSASTVTLALPAGSAAGDFCVLFAGHGYNVNNPAGWTVLDNQAGSNFNGAVFQKTLAAADITAGTVVITFGGSYYGWLAAISFATKINTNAVAFLRNAAGAATRSLTTAGAPAPAVGDYAIYFASARVNATVSSAGGTALQSNTANEGSGTLAGGTLASAGQVTNVFSFGGAPSGDYSAVVVVVDNPAITIASSAGIVRETMLTATGQVRLAGLRREALLTATGQVRLAGIRREVLRSSAIASSRRRKQFVTG